MSVDVKIAVVSPTAVYHVGLFDGRRERTSLEANCTSVSVCPIAWRGIAKLGGGDLWLLSNLQSRFLDMHRTPKTSRKAILAECVRHGWLRETQIWRAYMTDEDGDEGYCEFATRAEAYAEYDPDSDSRRPSMHRSYVGTPALRRIFGRSPNPGTEAQDFGVMAWAQAAGFDGVWWCESYEPEYYSAPRGAIFPQRLGRFHRTKVAWSSVSDNALLRRFPRATSVHHALRVIV